jgi:signal transduction histidine kinase
VGLVLAGLCFLVLAGDHPGPALHGAAAGTGLVVLAGLLLRLRLLDVRQRAAVEAAGDEVRRLTALLAASPDAWVAWSAGGVRAAAPGLADLLKVRAVARLDDVETALDPSDAAALHGSFQHLRETGVPFRLSLRLADGSRVLTASGSIADPGDGDRFHVLWLRDDTAAANERERATEAQRRAEAEMRRRAAVLDGLPLPVWLRRGDLSIIWCNAAFARMLEATPEQVVAEARELPASGLAEPPVSLARQALLHNRSESDARYVVVNGDRRLLVLTERPVPGQDLLLGFALDATAERMVRDELERHVAAHGEVLEQLGSAIAVFGADMRLRFFNHAYARLWDLDEGWLGTEPTYAEVLEDLRARRKLSEQVDFLRWKKQRLSLFTSLIDPEEGLEHLPDGRTLRSLVVPHPFGGLMFVLEDVTHTLALESSYNTLMAVQQETLDHLAEGVAVFGGDGRLKLFNPAFARLWRLDPTRLVAEPHADDVVAMARPLLERPNVAWETVRSQMVEGLLERQATAGHLSLSDGGVLRFAQVPLPDGAVLLSCLDVTDSARVEKALRASNEALEAADQLKSEFIANVSYQLRTPLNAIMGFAEILHNQYFGELNQRQMEYAKGVLEASRRLLALVNDILDLATIEAGFMVLDVDTVDVGPLLQSVAALTRDWARKQALDLRVEVVGDIHMDGDEKRLKQALFNLVSNAIRFTPPGGRITLEGKVEGDSVVMAVSDTGIGIPPADQIRVFGRFERAGGSAAKLTGAGLGLSLVKSFIELHHGRVEIQSHPDQGTTVRCVLPARQVRTQV